MPEYLAIVAGLVGNENAIDEYAKHAQSAPMIAAYDGHRLVGYVSIAEHFETNCELHSMGVLPSYQRQGIGQSLVNAARKYAVEQGHEFLSVKTLSAARDDPFYAMTRQFYQAAGFAAFEELPDYWGANLPCLILLQRLAKGD